jgi:hypothetical protein
MIFYIGIFLCILAVIFLVKFIQTSKKPRVHDVRIVEITSEPYEYASNISQRNVPHAKVEYYHQSVKHEKKILLKSKAKVGETISLSVLGKDGKDVEQFYPAKEVIAMIIMTAIGLSMILASLILTDYLY